MDGGCSRSSPGAGESRFVGSTSSTPAHEVAADRGCALQGFGRRGAQSILRRLQSSIGPDSKASDLSLAEQQIAEIAKALATKPRIFVMDEPTAALDDTEASRLLALVRRLSQDGVAVVYVSHCMPEIATISY